MAGFFARLFGGTTAVGTVLQPVAIGAGWSDIEVAGESYHRVEVSRLFVGLGRPEGGVTMQWAYLVPEPTNRYDRNAVKVMIRGQHVGYVPAELSRRVASACKALGSGQVGAVMARTWARVDDGVWRARVTLSFSGESEPEQDYAEQRRMDEQKQAERAAAVAQKAADREAKDNLKAAKKNAGDVRGEYWPVWKPAIAELKRQQRLSEAKDFLIECRDAADREAAVAGDIAEPWPTEQLAAVLRRLGDRPGELSTLEGYVRSCGTASVPESVLAKLAKARLANGLTISDAAAIVTEPAS